MKSDQALGPIQVLVLRRLTLPVLDIVPERGECFHLFQQLLAQAFLCVAAEQGAFHARYSVTRMLGQARTGGRVLGKSEANGFRRRDLGGCQEVV